MPPDPSRSLEELLTSARRAADAACAVHRRYSGRVRMDEAEEKGTSDFVSRVDREAQEAALAVLLERHPDHAVLAEEGDDEQDDAMRIGGARDDVPLWVVDPLDGTTNFLNGHPMYCASVAAWTGGRPVVGAVACTTTGERWWAARGGGAFKCGRRIRVSDQQRLSHALVGTGFPFKALDRLPVYLDQLEAVLRSTAGIRRGGSAALDLCHLADGTYEGFWEQFLRPWDVAAGVLIVEEAGGRITRIDGSPVDLEDGTILGAGSSVLHEALGERIREV